MENEGFDKWLRALDLSFWGTAQHKVTSQQFFERQQSEGAVLLDVRSPEEADYLALPLPCTSPSPSCRTAGPKFPPTGWWRLFARRERGQPLPTPICSCAV